MPVPIVRINPLEYPTNALVNFAPLNNALMQRRRAQEFDATLGEQQLQHDQANTLAQARLGLDRDRMGLETERLGIERGRFGLAQQAEARTEEDRRNTALANLGSTISSISDPNARRSAWERLVMSNPNIPTLLQRYGVSDPTDHVNGPRILQAQAQDALARGQVQAHTDLFRAQADRAGVVDTGPGHTTSELVPDPNNPGRMIARPLVTGPPAARPRDLTFTDINHLTEQGQQFSSVNRSIENFDPRYTSPGVLSALVRLGDIRNWAGRNLTSAPPEMQAAARWWQEYQLSTELGERNRLFGSALTASEQAAWERAAITPQMAPNQIVANLAARRRIAQDAMARRTQALGAAGFDTNVIARAYGMAAPDASTGGAQPPPGQPPPAGATGRAQPQEGDTTTFRPRGSNQPRQAIYRNGRWEYVD